MEFSDILFSFTDEQDEKKIELRKTQYVKREKNFNFQVTIRRFMFGVPIMAQWLMNPTRNHEIVGSIPGLA